jgi:hypothetical protein
MTKRFRLDGTDYAFEALSAEGQGLVERMSFAQFQVRALTNQKALLTKAKNAYIADLKSEIVQGRTGVDLGALFSDD